MATSSTPSTSTSPLPCLVLDYGGDQRATLFGVSDGAHRACGAEELRGKRAWPTSHGWVLACDPATAATFLWNPRAPPEAGGGRVLALPPLAQPSPPAESLRALSGRPTGAGGCTVVLVEPPHQSTVLCIPVPEGLCWCKRVISDLASCRGRFYYFHSATEYGVIDFPPAGPPAFGTVPMAKVPVEAVHGHGLHVPRGDRGELYKASVVPRRHDINSVASVAVHRMDFAFARKKPVRVRSIGDRAILAGSSSCFAGWCPAPEFGLQPNTVYWMSRKDKRLHVLDIGTGTDQVREPCKGVAERKKLGGDGPQTLSRADPCWMNATWTV
ncbi:hypothetical protein C2845_PM10G01800 [Panicum miliaceum]|uniref:KIB1-4 beta-propeller domain-containing protein n=1 Tax=Panicum miliaceum TaxID=4540 RepID=A0A3L6PFE1_PANMI|nr:hypothetical protein C2845_PM10G01800 [Panicum miliaceum]